MRFRSNAALLAVLVMGLIIGTGAVPAAAARPVPPGRTYLKTPTPPGTEFRVLFVRKGSSVRYAWLPSAGHANCFRGTYRDGQLIGYRVTNYYSGPVWSTEPLRLRVGKRVWIMGSQRYRVVRPSSKYLKANRRAMNITLRRCGKIAWPDIP